MTSHPGSTVITEYIARRFIARRDLKAIQRADGTYRPEHAPFSMSDLRSHINGTVTFGHYLLDQKSYCKLFCLDLDWKKSDGLWVSRPDITELLHLPPDQQDSEYERLTKYFSFPPRAAWQDRTYPARAWQKRLLREVAGDLLSRVTELLGVPCAAAYTGHKGVHIYGFTGYAPAAEAREAGKIVLDSHPDLTPQAGFWTGSDYEHGFGNLTVELYPKQDQIEPGSLGNLLRLPLGKNLRNPADPCFFLDMHEHATLRPHPDPATLLETGNPWR